MGRKLDRAQGMTSLCLTVSRVSPGKAGTLGVTGGCKLKLSGMASLTRLIGRFRWVAGTSPGFIDSNNLPLASPQGCLSCLMARQPQGIWTSFLGSKCECLVSLCALHSEGIQIHSHHIRFITSESQVCPDSREGKSDSPSG